MAFKFISDDADDKAAGAWKEQLAIICARFLEFEKTLHALI